MPVSEGRDGEFLEPNHVYVPPPRADTTVNDGRLHIRIPSADAQREDHPIDGFFDSLAADARENAVGIVLSGTGSDGALGLKAIKECGGFTIAQGGNGDGPEYEGMPAGAIATGAVDLIAPVEEMPGHLIRLQEARSKPSLTASESDAEVEAARLRICAVIRAQLGHDFSGYKDKTFLRRVRRRMQVVGTPTLARYIPLIEADKEEVVLLFRDLLIRVTSFFRDEETFEALEREVLPRLFSDKHADGTLRVWVPGCATGEEAYSLAIIMREYIDGMRGPPKIQVFGTDIDEPAIATARKGRYPATLLQGLSTDRRERFFTRIDSGFVVTKEIREMCTFSPHSLVRDPPFSKMDLISCRNLLIYMETELQGEVIPAFHYALVPGGVLMLGSAETTTRHEELFLPLNKPLRIYQRRDIRTPLFNLWRPDPDRYRSRVSAPAPFVPGAKTVTNTGAADQESPSDVVSYRRPGSSGAGGSAHNPVYGLRARLWTAWGRVAGRAELDAMRRELAETREQLQAVTEEHETALEELRSSNEELHSVNEELQSANEELETSKEEIQSVNEELHTVNAQLTEKVDELDRANSDLRNLFDSTQIATIFLDRHLIIRGFTPAVGAIYNLIRSDQGRSLTDIVSRLSYNGLREDIQRVLNTLEPLERQVVRSDGTAHYLMRILPYRSADSRVDGTLVTFLDVTSIVRAEEHQRLLVDELNHRVKNMLTVVMSLAAQTMRRAVSLAGFLGSLHGSCRGADRILHASQP